MVICCAALNCSNRQGKAPRGRAAVSFHRFPLKDSKRLIQWLKAVQRDNWTPTKYSFLCSEHFTKDSFSKRLEDQHRLLKPTAVPTIFQDSEKKGSSRDHVRRKRRIASQTVQGDDNQSKEGSNEVIVGILSSDQHLIVEGMKEMEQVTLQAEIGSMSEQGENFQVQLEGSLRRMLADNLVTKVVQSKPEKQPLDDCTETIIHPECLKMDKSGISADDFTPPVSGACKFIGSLHSYSFFSKHTRERSSLPKEQLERKRLRRTMEPSCSSNTGDQNTTLTEATSTSSLTAIPQKPPQTISASPADLTPKPATEAVVGQKGETDANPMSINEVIMSASGACKLIDSLHSYCFSSRQNKSQVCCLREQVEKKNGELKQLRQKISRSDSQVRKLKEKLNELKRINFPFLNNLLSQDGGQYLLHLHKTPQLNPVIEPLSWMLGTWLSDPPGDGTFPTMKPFQYLEEVHISHVGQPMLNFSFNAFHPDTRKPMHRECGFIRIKPDTNKVAFISAQNTGLVEVEEGEVNGQELSIASHSVARISFAKKPHVEQITRKFRLNSDGKLEQTVCMGTTTQPMTQHLHITYKKVTP
ncbi:peroxynitrite isomerase THAP4 isoform X1 [Pogona vitticeps]|uniref:Peroxynitrite isomerase THAP4 isoform X1 n=2 Tax=Pogona vitticeps TaxID=103695 RepID=A0A6J0T4Q9_9SAUR